MKRLITKTELNALRSCALSTRQKIALVEVDGAVCTTLHLTSGWPQDKARTLVHLKHNGRWEIEIK
jgi:hypothetical protein